MVSQELTKVIGRIAELTTCKDCGAEVSQYERTEGAARLQEAGLDEPTSFALSSRCSLCISELIGKDVVGLVSAELLLVALEVAARGTGRVFIAYSNDAGVRHISVTTNNAVVKEMRNWREPGQALLYLGRIA